MPNVRWGYMLNRWHNQLRVAHALKDNNSPACGASYYASTGACDVEESHKCKRCLRSRLVLDTPTTYYVWSLDVWGHGPDECEEHACKDEDCEDEDCPCPHPGSDDEVGTCDCHESCEGFQVNDRSKVGTVEVYTRDKDGPTEREITLALVEQGYLKDHVTVDDLSFEWMEDGWQIDEEPYGRPLFELEKVE